MVRRAGSSRCGPGRIVRLRRGHWRAVKCRCKPRGEGEGNIEPPPGSSAEPAGPSPSSPNRLVLRQSERALTGTIAPSPDAARLPGRRRRRSARRRRTPFHALVWHPDVGYIARELRHAPAIKYPHDPWPIDRHSDLKTTQRYLKHPRSFYRREGSLGTQGPG